MIFSSSKKTSWATEWEMSMLTTNQLLITPKFALLKVGIILIYFVTQVHLLNQLQFRCGPPIGPNSHRISSALEKGRPGFGLSAATERVPSLGFEQGVLGV